MKVNCQDNKGANLGEAYYKIGYSHESEFDLKVGEIYVVFAQCTWKGCLLYLLDPENINRPSWYPASLFAVTDSTLSQTWQFLYFKQHEEVDGVSAIWGYPELVFSDEHFDELIDRNVEAIKIFTRHKLEISTEAISDN